MIIQAPFTKQMIENTDIDDQNKLQLLLFFSIYFRFEIIPQKECKVSSYTGGHIAKRTLTVGINKNKSRCRTTTEVPIWNDQ